MIIENNKFSQSCFKHEYKGLSVEGEYFEVNFYLIIVDDEFAIIEGLEENENYINKENLKLLFDSYNQLSRVEKINNLNFCNGRYIFKNNIIEVKFFDTERFGNDDIDNPSVFQSWRGEYSNNSMYLTFYSRTFDYQKEEYTESPSPILKNLKFTRIQ